MELNESVGMKRPSSLTGAHCTAQQMSRTSFIHPSIHLSTHRLGNEQYRHVSQLSSGVAASIGRRA